MRYVTYYEESSTITVGRYQQMKQGLMKQGVLYKPEKHRFRKLQFIGKGSQEATADYFLCMKEEDTEQIYLEKKYQQNGIYFKKCLKITKKECEDILKGNLEWMKGHKKELLSDFYRQITLNHLSPGYVTEYETEMVCIKKGSYVTFFRKINRGVGITNRLFERPEMVIPCLDEGKVRVAYKRAAKLPEILSNMLQSSEEQSEETAFVF